MFFEKKQKIANTCRICFLINDNLDIDFNKDIHGLPLSDQLPSELVNLRYLMMHELKNQLFLSTSVEVDLTNVILHILTKIYSN